MATTEELLAQLEAEAQIETPVCIIDPDTRTITVPPEYQLLGVEGDKMVERIPFCCPKIVGDNQDLSQDYILFINYVNASGDPDAYRIDDMTDKIEEVFIRIYMNRITSIRPEAIQMLDIVIGCCKEVANLMGEFADFRHSKKLKEGIIHINTMEEEADSLFISSMRALHAEREDIFQVLAWREIFEFLEKCADACEHVADGVESVVMKNS